MNDFALLYCGCLFDQFQLFRPDCQDKLRTKAMFPVLVAASFNCCERIQFGCKELEVFSTERNIGKRIGFHAPQLLIKFHVYHPYWYSFLGWVDDMTPLRFGQVSALMDTSIRVDGKITTRREFIINCIKDGWVPQKKDGVTSWYKRGGEYRESNPRTEYELHKEGFVYVYKISKTEYDFAVYLVEHGAAS